MERDAHRMTRKIGPSLLALAVGMAAAGGVAAAPAKKSSAPIKAPTIQSCDAHQFETTIKLMGPDGQIKQSKVKMCGTVGQSDADWIHTLEDAAKKTSLSAQMPLAAKEQIIAAVNSEIERLSNSGLALPGGTDISKLPQPDQKRTEETSLARDYGSLPPLPTASNVPPPSVLAPGGGIGAPPPRLTLRCATPGDEDRPATCDSIDNDTVIVVRADEAFPRGVAMRFVRHGAQRAELDLPALRVGQTANLRLPKAVCSGVVRSKLEIQALGGGAPSGTAAGTVGEYDLRC